MGMDLTMKRYKYIAIIVSVSMLLTTLFNSPYSMVTADNPCINWDWNIENNTIFVNNSLAYLSATPHTLTSKGWVEFEFKSKKFSGNIDIGFGFNTTTAKPKKLEIWKNGNWSPFGFDCNIVDYSTCFFRNTDTWYLYTDIPIKKDERYKIRGYIDIPFGGLNGSSGKYWLIIKPHDKTIAQSIFDGHLLYLDPWWNTEWDYYRTITIESDYIDSELTDFPILVSINDTIGDRCKANGEDIVFVLTDNSTVLNHEIEKWVDNGDRLVWVNVTTIASDVDTVFLMYYGNADASDSQNPSGVWDSNYLGVWHMDYDAGVTDSTSNAYDMTRTGTITTLSTGKIGDCQESVYDSGGSNYIESDVGFFDELDTTFTWSYWLHVDNNDYNYGTVGTSNSNEYDGDMQNDYKGWSNTNGWVYTACDNGAGAGVYLNTVFDGSGTWQYYTFTRNGNTISWYRNGVLAESDATTWSSDETVKMCLMRYHGGSGAGSWKDSLDGKIDEFRMSSNVRSLAWDKACYHTQIQTEGFLIWGEEQVYSPVNYPPIQADEIPVNTSIDIGLTPSLYVLCTDADNNNLNATWWSNSSGNWVQFASNWTSFANGTNITQTNSNFSEHDTTYWWSLNLTDGENWVNKTYHFTTEEEEEIWDYSQPLSWLIRNETGVTILKLSMSGNMAIAGTLYEQDIKEVKKHVQHIESFLEDNYGYTPLEWV